MRGTTPTRVTDWLSFSGRRASVMTTWRSSSAVGLSASSAARSDRGEKQARESAAPTSIGRIQDVNDYHFHFQQGKRDERPCFSESPRFSETGSATHHPADETLG